MEGFVAQKLNDFETGKISRRKLIETLTLAATTTAAAESAQAQESPLKAQLINHLSYTCPDFKKAADWYSMVLNCDQVGQTKRDVVVVFGKKGEQPYNVTAKDVPHSHLVVRTPSNEPPPPGRGGERARPQPLATIDHVGYTVLNFNRAEAKAKLIAMGVKNVRDGGLYSLHMDDAFGYDVQLSGLDNNALTDG
jgi:catechol 2,3-dioxygenase-like lactoylglutathione lyase family enzyme